MRKWSLYGLIAKRYLFSLRKQTAVSILSKISMGALVVSTAAMILLFSVFNGFESLVKNLYATFYPDIKITVYTTTPAANTNNQRHSIPEYLY